MNKHFYSEVKEVGDGTGDVSIELPEELLNELGWEEGTVLNYKIEDGFVTLTAKKDNI
jgi:hypothetical protein